MAIRLDVHALIESMQGDQTMFDLFMIAIGLASFAILILYTAACERM